MKARFLISVVPYLFLLQQCAAQSFPGWEDPIQVGPVLSTHSIISSYSDGYGQHVLTAPVSGTGLTDYFLLGTDGQPVYSSPNPFPVSNSSVSGAITGYQSVVYAVLEVSGQIKIYSSTNGGELWSSSSGYTPPTTIESIDAFADAHGIHIVWDSEGVTLNEVYYVLFDPSAGFLSPQQITDMGTVTGRFPKVLTSGDRLIVSFVTTHLNNDDRGATRDADISGTTPVGRITPDWHLLSRGPILRTHLPPLILETRALQLEERHFICKLMRTQALATKKFLLQAVQSAHLEIGAAQHRSQFSNIMEQGMMRIRTSGASWLDLATLCIQLMVASKSPAGHSLGLSFGG